MHLAAVGDNCIDRYGPPLAMSLVGGNAVNVAVQSARLGRQVGYFGAVGRDADGRRTRAALVANGVDVNRLRRSEVSTAFTDIAVRSDGDRVIAFEDFGACRDYRSDEADRARIVEAAHVHIGWLNDGGALRRFLVARGHSVSRDVSVNAAAEALDVAGLTIAFASAGEDLDGAWTRVAGLLAAGAACAVVTCGALGSVASNGRVTAEAGIVSVPVVDTTGAGDSFIAGFLVGHAESRSLQACLEAGRDAAATTCTHWGGFPQTPRPWPAPLPWRKHDPDSRDQSSSR